MGINLRHAWWQRVQGPISHASREVLVTAVITLTPVWAGAALSMLFQEANSFWLALSENTAKGDLFLLAIAAIAPLMLYLSERTGTLPKPLTVHFPGGWFFMLSLIILFGGATILFSIKRTSELPDSTLKLNQNLFVTLSIVTYLASILLSLVITAVKFSIDSMKPEDIFREDTANFVKSWRTRQK